MGSEHGSNDNQMFLLNLVLLFLWGKTVATCDNGLHQQRRDLDYSRNSTAAVLN